MEGPIVGGGTHVLVPTGGSTLSWSCSGEEGVPMCWSRVRYPLPLQESETKEWGTHFPGK